MTAMNWLGSSGWVSCCISNDTALTYVTVVLVGVILMALTTRLYSNLLRSHKRTDGNWSVAMAPYWLPLLGHIPAIAIDQDGFLAKLRDASAHGVFAINLGGSTHNLAHTPSLVRGIFAQRSIVEYEGFHLFILNRFFGMPRSFNKTLCHVIGDLSQIVNRYLLRDPGLSKMLAVTIDAFEESIPNLVSFASSPAGQSPWERVSNANVWRGSKETGEPDVAMETSLFPLLRNFLGHLATPSIMGQDFMNNYPEVLQDVWNLDYGLMYLIAGLPLWLPIPTLRRAARARERLNRQITELHRAMDIAEDGGDPGKEWRDLRDVGLVIKERHRVWRSHKIPPHLRADLPLLWAMNANAPSLTFWVILRILTNPSLVERIRAEIAPHVQVSQPHIGFGMTEPPRLKISMAGLRTGCPLLKSCYFETLRVDSAAWSVKRVVKDFVLTEDEKDARGGTKRSFALKTGEYINIPFGLHQSDPRYFHSPESFIGDRFLVQGADGKDEVDIGSLKPYGAGFAICKGRVFAEAEVLAFVASIIALWDFEPASAKGWEIPDHVKASGVALPKTDVRVRIRRRKIS